MTNYSSCLISGRGKAISPGLINRRRQLEDRLCSTSGHYYSNCARWNDATSNRGNAVGEM